MMEFDGYFNLMNHRKLLHPSNKKCRNFPDSCNFGNQCWYVHEEKMDIDPPIHKQDDVSGFTCNLCDQTFREKANFMKHKKDKHTGSNRPCEKFANGQCDRTADVCWYVHSTNQTKQDTKTKDNISREQVFRQVPVDTLPPDQMSRMFWMVSNLCRKVEGMEKRFEDLMI